MTITAEPLDEHGFVSVGGTDVKLQVGSEAGE